MLRAKPLASLFSVAPDAQLEKMPARCPYAAGVLKFAGYIKQSVLMGVYAFYFIEGGRTMDINYYKQYEPVFGAWKITRLIGEGSFGKVFEMEREDFGITYKAALKAITVPANQSELREVMAEGMDEASIRTYFGSFVQDLVKEFALMSKLKGNSNVVSYENHQVIEHRDGIGWDILIQMELLTPLNKYTRTHAVTRQDVIKLGIDLCKALELCQKYNIIHRDVKPENIFISEVGDFKLGDFGIARTVEKTTSGLSKKGTYTYMAPEVYKGEPYGSTVDIYSLGIVLYRLLNGSRTPFLPAAPALITHADRENALVKRFSGVPIPPPCHGEGRLAEIVLKACAYNPKERYSSPMQMRQELEAILYNREEQPYIYPEGDNVPQDSLRYAGSSTTAPSVPPVPSVPPEQAGPGPYPTPDGEKSGFNNANSTIHIFGDTATAFLGPEQRDATVAAVNDFTRISPPPAPSPAPSPETSPAQTVPSKKKSSAKLWIGLGSGIGAACLLAILLTVVFFLQNASVPAASPSSKTEQNGSAHTDTEANSPVPAENYLETVKDEEGRILQYPVFNYDGSVSYTVYEYNDQGNRVRYRTFNLLGELEEETVNEFDSNNKCIGSKRYDGDGNLTSYDENTFQNGKLSRSDTYDSSAQLIGYSLFEEYDSQGRNNKFSNYAPDGSLVASYAYERDSEGRILKNSYSDEKGFSSSVVSEYDSQGLLLTDTNYNAEGNIQSVSEYDELGRTIKYTSYNKKGKPSQVTESIYDEKGFRTRQNELDGSGHLQRFTQYTYNERGKRSTEARYSENNILSYEVKYDDHGNEIKTSYYDDDGALSSYSQSEYDEDGTKIKGSSYRADGTLSSATEYAEGRAFKVSYYTAEGQLNFYTEYEYNEDGKRIKDSTYESDGTLRSYTLSEYDTNGDIAKETGYRADGTVSNISEYMENYTIAKESYYNEKGQLDSYWEYEYEYDKNGFHTKTNINIYEADGTLSKYGVIQYDDNGDYVDTIWYNPDGTKQE